MVSLSTVPRLSLLSGQPCGSQADVWGGDCCFVADWCPVRSRFHARIKWCCGRERQFSGNSTQKDNREHCKHHDGSVGSALANHHGGGEISMVVTTLAYSSGLIWIGFLLHTWCIGLHAESLTPSLSVLSCCCRHILLSELRHCCARVFKMLTDWSVCLCVCWYRVVPRCSQARWLVCHQRSMYTHSACRFQFYVAVILYDINELFYSMATGKNQALLLTSYFSISCMLKVKSIAVRRNSATLLRETHMPYGITQCYLPPDRGENPAFTPSRSRYSI